MEHKTILGFSMIIIGALIGIGIGTDFVLSEVIEPIRTIYGLIIFFGVAIPLMLSGSIISETAPNFIMNRVKKSL